MQKFNTGDSVRFLEETGTGIILEIRGQEALVAAVDGFADWYPVQLLLHVKPPEPEPSPPILPQKLTKQRVRFMHEAGSGEVLTEQNGQYLIATSEGFQVWMESRDLIFLTDEQQIKIDPKELAAIKHAELHPKKLFRKKAADNRREVDLHIHELLETTRGMTKHALYEYQMAAAQDALFEARKSGIKYLVLIHGKGKGKLRAGLMEWLANMERVAFYDASYARYGGGALEVNLL
jgi:dsDNA-specific endonuclease/ATPase MutS2